MKFTRFFSKSDQPVTEQVEWKTVEIKVPSTSAIQAVEVPAWWSDNAAMILVRNYLRKAGVPQGGLDGVETPGMPAWLWSRQADPGIPTGAETSARQVFHRMAGCWTYWGWRSGVFRVKGASYQIEKENNAQIFYDECYMMLARQIGAPNSPQWFNTGLHWAYGIEGPASGQWAVDEEEYWTNVKPDGTAVGHSFEAKRPKVYETTNSYERPQPHACFIQPVTDDLVNPGGIMDLWLREVRLFKYGSGTGTNFSRVRGRGEPLSGGGKSSGLMSFLRIGDRAAGSIKSGGTTRRAAKMVVVDADHPEIEEFIDWKAKEEYKAAAMYVGSQILKDRYDKGLIHNTPDGMLPTALVDRMRNGFEPEILGVDFEGEAIDTVGGQNSNNSVRVTDDFMERAGTGPEVTVQAWELKARTDGRMVKLTSAKDLFDRICRAAWACADPGLQFHDIINEWHTCPNDGQINASNPCSEYMFLDDTACNLASLNLVAFLRPDGTIDLEAYEHAVCLWTVVLDISVTMASFPSKEIALGSYNYRTLGLGYANLGGLLMRLAIPYDSDEGRALAAALTALMHFTAYRTSNEMAKELGPFPRWEANKEPMARVMDKHRARLMGLQTNQPYLIENVVLVACGQANAIDPSYGFRNAQVTLLAPTGTISFVMDCFTADTLVATADGRNAVSFGQLAAEGKDVDVYASDNGCTVVKTMRNIRPIRRSPVVKITLDDGSEVRCTREHLFMLRDGTYKQAAKLQHGDSLMRFDSVIKDCSGVNRRAVWMGPNYGGNRNRGKGWSWQYRLIGMRKYPHYNGRSGGLIHHWDEDALNDRPNNLHYCTSTSEHHRLHWANMTDVERSAFGKRRIIHRDQKANSTQLDEARIRSGTPEARAKAALAYPTEARSARMIESYKNVSPEARAAKAKKIWDTRRARAAANHKVVSVVPDGIEIMYCGEVEDVRNFAIVTSNVVDARNDELSGVVVHNCDTTGVEPDFSLVKDKNLAGGGQMKIVNQSVKVALRRLGYSEQDVKWILDFINEKGRFPISNDSHRAHDNRVAAVFATANDIRPMAHVEMVAAVQPFLSGAVSKTINMPNHATIEDVSEVYRRSWELQLKAVAVYRDGCKLAQPLSAAKPGMEMLAERIRDQADRTVLKMPRPITSKEEADLIRYFEHLKSGKAELLQFDSGLARGERERLPARRGGYTQKARVGGQTVYLRTGEWPDGRLGEIFVDLANAGSTLDGFANCLAKMTSIALQFGAPADKVVEALLGTRFEPDGVVEEHERIKMAASIPDFVAKDLAINYLGREDLANTIRMVSVGEGKEVVALDKRAMVLAGGKVTGRACPACHAGLVLMGTCWSCPSCEFSEGGCG
jgi:adenosylcobalamin-dependent ribonucleoside-diphosphate reductase